jgi:lipoprotein signal peptidase
MKHLNSIFFTSIVIIDQIIKQIAYYYYKEGFVLKLWLFETSYQINKGISFGLIQNSPLVYIFGIVAIAFLINEARKEKHTIRKYAYLMIIASGVSNILDRFINDGKGVVDFLIVKFSKIFYINDAVVNLADILIIAGFIVLTFINNENKKAK